MLLTENHVAVGEHRLAAKHTADQLAKQENMISLPHTRRDPFLTAFFAH